MKRIVFNGKFLSQRATGVQRVATELVLALDTLAGEPRSGLDSMELVLAAPPNATTELSLKHVRVEIVGRRTGVAWEQLELPAWVGDAQLVSLGNVAPVARRGDIVMIHDAQAFLTPQSYSLGFRTWYRTLLPLVAQRAERVVTVSRYAAACLDRFRVAPEEKISVVTNGVDHILRPKPDLRAAAKLSVTDRPWVVAPASTQAHKNIGILFDAFRGPELSGVRLVLVGSASRGDFERVGLNAPPGTVFAGRLSDAEMVGLVSGASAFAFPSTTEGFGLPPLEAMLLGTPAVVAPCGALPELCGDAVLYAEPEDPAAWASAIFRLAGDPILREGYAAAGRLQASQYTWARSARQFADLLLA